MFNGKMSDDLGDTSASTPQPRIGVPMTAEAIAARVRAAYDNADLDEFAALLSPDVHWGAPGDATPPCQNRNQVLAWYTKGREQGRRATVDLVEVHGNAVLVGLVHDGGGERWQVLRVGPDGVNDIRGYERREEALEKLAP